MSKIPKSSRSDVTTEVMDDEQVHKRSKNDVVEAVIEETTEVTASPDAEGLILKYSDSDIKQLIEQMPGFWYTDEEQETIFSLFCDMDRLSIAQLNASQGDAMVEVLSLLNDIKEKRILANRCSLVQSERKKVVASITASPR